MVSILPVAVDPSETGERGERCAQAEVPGSSEPSGQSQKSSFRRSMESCMEGADMHVKVSESL